MLNKTAQPTNWPLIVSGIRGISNLPQNVRQMIDSNSFAFPQSCPDKPGAIAYVSTEDLNNDGNIDIINIVVPAFNTALKPERLTGLDKASDEYKDIMSQIASVLVHEAAHIDDYTQDSGFLGGEGVAEAAERTFEPIFASNNLSINNKDKNMINDLIKLANHFDNIGEQRLANFADSLIKSAGTEEVVSKIQDLLNENFGATLSVDGQWGPNTEAAFSEALSGRTAPNPAEALSMLQAALPSGTPIEFLPETNLEFGMNEGSFLTARKPTDFEVPEGVRLSAQRINQMYNDIGEIYNNAVQMVVAASESAYGEKGVPYPQLQVQMALKEEGMQDDAVAAVDALASGKTAIAFYRNERLRKLGY
jgi:hypothetical protein